MLRGRARFLGELLEGPDRLCAFNAVVNARYPIVNRCDTNSCKQHSVRVEFTEGSLPQGGCLL